MENRNIRSLITAIVVLPSFYCVLVSSEAKEIKVISERNVPVPMRDGTILRADVYRPDRGGPYPVLLERTPYGKEDRVDCKQFVKAGYIFVSQDVRGRGNSEGKWESFYRFQTHDAEDGYDTVEWAANLVGSNGRVGTVGNSYDGFLQWRLAPLRPPSLLAMSATGIDARNFIQPIGSAPCVTLLWWDWMSVDRRRRENLPGLHTFWEVYMLLNMGDRERWRNFLPRLQLPRELFGDEEEAYKYLLKNPHMDPWRLDEGCKDVSVPNFEIAGWYDPGKGDMTLYKAIVKEGKTEIARRGSRIIIGPWPHSANGSRYGDFDFGPNAGIDRIAVQVRWFDYWLKGEKNGVDKDAPVRIFVMGDNKWRDEQFWPLRHAKERVLFLTSEGHANTPKGNGRLVEKLPQSSGIDRYEYNPRNPAPGAGFIPDNRNRKALIHREDILVYETELLAERIEVTGNPVVELYAASSAPDTDWYVWLNDVFPDGRALEVSTGKVRVRYRNGLDKPKLVKPGEGIKYTIRMHPTSNAFLPGHRIRLDVGSSDFPRYDINHNTAANQYADATLVTAKQTIYHGGEHTARIILPWIPNAAEGKSLEHEDLNVASEKNMYSLHLAATTGDIKEINLLISEGANVNTKDEKQRTPLHYAAEAGRKEVVQLLIEARADLNCTDKDNRTPASLAMANDHKDVAELLVSKGADLSLHLVAYMGNLEEIKSFIKNGVNLDAKDVDKKTPLHYAVETGKIEVVKVFVEAGADVNVKDDAGMTPLNQAISANKKDIAELLLKKITDLGLKDERGLTALHNAAVEGHQEIAELFLSKGAKVDERDDEYGFTPLHYAARFGNKKVAEVLIAHGADIKAKDKWAYEPIHWAAYHDRSEIIELLIAKGADVNVKTLLGQMPLELAMPRRNTGAIEVLRKHGAKEHHPQSELPLPENAKNAASH